MTIPASSAPTKPEAATILDLLATGVLLVDAEGRVAYANPAAENLLETSSRALLRQPLWSLFTDAAGLRKLCAQALEQQPADFRQDLTLARPGREPLHVHAAVSAQGTQVVLELRENVHQLKLDREERLLEQGQANKELVRNLAHEIKNPLGGIRGAAQLLELELPAAAGLSEYTQVIIKEADRLQTLVDRLLLPHRQPHIVGDVNIHEVLERVRSLVQAEFPAGLEVVRDYDASLPEFRGDKAQLIQAVLNIVRNAAQALAAQIAGGGARIVLRTRVARQVTLAKVRYPLALDLHIIDNGPGIPDALLDHIFFPLVSGREGGNGLGLTLAQTFVHQHQGVIECESRPGCTDFRILLPLP
jgi:two-component system nitrogen regulation sensor histidine kinase GlnL